jgi:transcriptional regulator with XRE-family HTH domain
VDRDHFGTWLEHQLRRRAWSQADFVRNSGLSRSAVSAWITGTRIPDPESCDRIADALHIDVETVLRKAGHLPDVETLDEFTEELIGLIKRIDWTPDRVAFVRSSLQSMAQASADRRKREDGEER